MTSATLRNATRFAKITLASLVVAACVTINVYFPAAAAEKAADQVIDAITGATGTRPQAAPAAPAAPPTGQTQYRKPGVLVAAIGQMLYAVVPAAQAQDAANIDISSPEIRAIQSSMAARFSQLRKFFDSGALGLTQDGLVQIRDAGSLSLPDRGLLNRLVAEDNKDRESLYTEIAKANGHPEWAGDLRKTFARRWVERGAQAGWYYQNASGAWVQK
ncbi:MAG: YdbL family protein [Steroidobacteraceae bacterium]